MKLSQAACSVSLIHTDVCCYSGHTPHHTALVLPDQTRGRSPLKPVLPPNPLSRPTPSAQRHQGAYFIGLQKYHVSLICTHGRGTKCHAHKCSPFSPFELLSAGTQKTFKPLCDVAHTLIHASVSW